MYDVRVDKRVECSKGQWASGKRKVGGSGIISVIIMEKCNGRGAHGAGIRSYKCNL